MYPCECKCIKTMMMYGVSCGAGSSCKHANYFYENAHFFSWQCRCVPQIGWPLFINGQTTMNIKLWMNAPRHCAACQPRDSCWMLTKKSNFFIIMEWQMTEQRNAKIWRSKKKHTHWLRNNRNRIAAQIDTQNILLMFFLFRTEKSQRIQNLGNFHYANFFLSVY